MSLPQGPAILFCPADRPERFAKAAERADGVILDLEDAVSADRREDARAAVVGSGLDPERTAVRLSASGGEEFDLDCAATVAAGYRWAIVPKCESAGFGAHPGLSFIPQVETARGLRELDPLMARSDVTALYWGVEDLVRSLGGSAARDESGRSTDVVRHVRSSILIAAAVAGKPAIDTVLSDYRDEGLQEAEARSAARMGFAATACVHPAQVTAIRAGYRPRPDELAWAEEVVAAAGEGAFGLSGRMVDAPVVAQAQRILSRERAAGRDD